MRRFSFGRVAVVTILLASCTQAAADSSVNPTSSRLAATNAPASTKAASAPAATADRSPASTRTTAPVPTTSRTDSPTPAPTIAQPSAAPRTEVPTSAPTLTPRLVPPTTTPTVAPTVAPTLRPATLCGAPANPWNYTFCSGSFITAPPSTFCNYFNCIANFWNGVGYVMQCGDLTFSKSGGRSGSCSQHGGNNRALYAPA